MPISYKRNALQTASNSALRNDHENGSIMVTTLVVSAVMVGVGGIALNTMYYETKRVEVQSALDRCSVMAALAQKRTDGGAATNRTAEQVAQDCVNKSLGTNEALTADIDSENSGRSATLSDSQRFVRLTNKPKWSPVFDFTATAEQTLPNIELTIAVDVSLPLFWGWAREPLIQFVNTIAASDTANKVSVNIVPFTNSVNLGTDLISRFNTLNEPPFSTNGNRSCLLFPESDKDDIAIDLNASYYWSWPLDIGGVNKVSAVEHGTYFERYTQAWADAQTPPQPSRVGTGQVEVLNRPLYADGKGLPTGNCHFVSTGNSIMLGAQASTPDSGSESAITNKLNAIVPYDSVSMPYNSYRDSNSAEGMKWALAAMDPSLRPIFTQQIGAGISPETVAGRPLDYGTDNSLKILVFIPNNTFNIQNGGFVDPTGNIYINHPSRVREIKPEYLDGSKPDPDIWRTPVPGSDNNAYRYSIFHEDAPDPAKPYWITYSYHYTADPYLEIPAQWAAAPFQYPGGEPPVQQSWRDVFETMSVDYLITSLYQAPMQDAGILPGDSDYSYATLANRFTYIATDSTKAMDNFTALCNKAKNNGVVIYTLLGSGTANTNGDTVWNTRAALARQRYTQCATSSAHSYATGGEAQINYALRLIASNIAQVKLEQ